jgi:hypothetical protein
MTVAMKLARTAARPLMASTPPMIGIQEEPS